MPIADVVDECIHLLTTAFCSICKANHRAAEGRRRRTRATNHPAWDTEETLPYPEATAQYRSLCPSCDEWMEEGTMIYRADGGWCCRPCAEDYATLGVGVDG